MAVSRPPRRPAASGYVWEHCHGLLQHKRVCFITKIMSYTVKYLNCNMLAAKICFEKLFVDEMLLSWGKFSYLRMDWSAITDDRDNCIIL